MAGREDGCAVGVNYEGEWKNERSADACDAFTSGEWVPAWRGAEAPTAVGQYAFTGIETLLSRCNLEMVRVLTRVNALSGDDFVVEEPVSEIRQGSGLARSAIEGWIVCAKKAVNSTK